MMNRIALIAMLCFCGCSEPEVWTSEDVAAFCSRHCGHHIGYGRLMESLEHVGMSREIKSGMLSLSIIASGDISGLDTCWTVISYDLRKERIVACDRSCQ